MTRFQNAIFLLALTWAMTPALHAQGSLGGAGNDSSTGDPARPPLTLTAVRAGGAIAVDGVLDDEGWRDAAVVEGFWEVMPGEGRPAVKPTRVRVAYDSQTLYVAFHAFDDPSAVRATRGQRDRVFDDDLVVVTIDPRGTAEWGLAFGANPHGVQVDLRDNGMNQDPKLDLIYETAGRITDDGYVVEMAIPFSSIGEASEEASWGINFLRMHPRDTRWMSSWAPLTRANSCTLCQHGTISGFQDVEASGTWSLMPAVVASQASARSGEGGEMAHDAPQMEPSLGLGYRTAGGWSIEGTYNPDFSQVESDVVQIDVNSPLALFHPEKRPFFQEGAEIFDTPVRTVYTRSVNDPMAAFKVRGEAGGWQLGYLAAYDETSPVMVPLRERTLVGRAGGSTSQIFRARRSLGSGAFAGFMATDRIYDSGSRGSSFGVDGLMRLGEAYAVSYQLFATRTAEADEGAFAGSGESFRHAGRTYTAAHDGETFEGYGGRISLARDDRHTRLALIYGVATPTAQAANGFLQKNDYHDLELNAGLSFQPEGGWIKDVSPRLEVGREWSFGGGHLRSYVEPWLRMMLTGQVTLAAIHYHADETFRGREFRGLDRSIFSLHSAFSERLGARVQIGYGDQIARTLAEPEAGRELSGSVGMTFKPTSQLVIEPRVSFARLERASGEEIHRGAVSRVSTSYQLTRELSGRVTAQYNSFSGRFEVDPLVTYQMTPFSMFYLGATHDLGENGPDGGWRLGERQIFLKFQYRFQR